MFTLHRAKFTNNGGGQLTIIAVDSQTVTTEEVGSQKTSEALDGILLTMQVQKGRTTYSTNFSATKETKQFTRADGPYKVDLIVGRKQELRLNIRDGSGKPVGDYAADELHS